MFSGKTHHFLNRKVAGAVMISTLQTNVLEICKHQFAILRAVLAGCRGTDVFDHRDTSTGFAGGCVF